MAEHWYAVQSGNRQEAEAVEHAERFGLGALVPMRERLVIVNRHTKKRELRSFPIVSGIVFVNAPEPMTESLALALCAPLVPNSRFQADRTPEGMSPQSWGRLCASTKGFLPSPITGVYGAGGVPSRIRWDEIDEMQLEGDNLEALERAKARGQICPYDPGETVRIKIGPFSGFQAVVVGGLHSRLSLLIHILGREAKAEMGVDDVEMV